MWCQVNSHKHTHSIKINLSISNYGKIWSPPSHLCSINLLSVTLADKPTQPYRCTLPSSTPSLTAFTLHCSPGWALAEHSGSLLSSSSARLDVLSRLLLVMMLNGAVSGARVTPALDRAHKHAYAGLTRSSVSLYFGEGTLHGAWREKSVCEASPSHIQHVSLFSLSTSHCFSVLSSLYLYSIYAMYAMKSVHFFLSFFSFSHTYILYI